MQDAQAADVLLVSLGSTEGLRRADDELQDSLRRAGARVAVARPFPPERLPTLMLTDLAWARAARAAARKVLVAQRQTPARAVIYSSTTAALLWSRPGAIRFDATAAGNRPGRHGVWQRPLERRRLRQAPLLIPWSVGGLQEAPAQARAGDRALVLPVAVEPSAQAAAAEERDIAALTYAANPAKKGLARVLAAWRRVLGERGAEQGTAGAPEELLVAGASARQLEQAGLLSSSEPGVRVLGALAPREFRALLRRTRAFVCAPRREDYGIVQLEALADGCQLVTTAAPGPYQALAIARELDPRLVGEDLAGALRTALEDPLPGYAERARHALEPFRRESVDRLVAEQLLPRLLVGATPRTRPKRRGRENAPDRQ
ncbi:MAG TPA: glycosyltransferase [Solirubrobacteraceae bacterium]|nr:glycosyltransferase [Solirubrobacteraceae bacterium]